MGEQMRCKLCVAAGGVGSARRLGSERNRSKRGFT
jgi:hypothetical protein